MSDIELYKHFKSFVFELNEFGYCFVRAYDYYDFVKELHICDIEQGFKADVITDGDLCFHIDDVERFFDDFDSFKKCMMDDYKIDKIIEI